MITVGYRMDTGGTRWRSRYDGPSRVSWGEAVGSDATGVIVTGFSRGPNGLDYATVAYDPGSGRVIWARRFDDPAHGDDESVGIALEPDGLRVFVTGWSEAPSAEPDFTTVAYAR